MIAQLVINLLQNAVTHAGHGGTITLDATQSAGKVALVVADDGPSIPEDMQSRIVMRLISDCRTHKGS